jgi:excisionase family DNA binding protein
MSSYNIENDEIRQVIREELSAIVGKRYLSVQEACDYLSVRPTTLYKMMREGLPYFQLNGARRIDKKVLDAFVKTHTNDPYKLLKRLNL